MRRFLLDTGIASDYINRRHGVLERAKEEVARGNRIGICVPVVGELFAGVEASASREKTSTNSGVRCPCGRYGHTAKRRLKSLGAFSQLYAVWGVRSGRLTCKSPPSRSVWRIAPSSAKTVISRPCQV